ncbi:MAG TPA: fatty acid desaturase [Candidatus Acidoferrum sp.]|nr:fatty acid desaturase [Candidatus Acidoferrum sp.]
MAADPQVEVLAENLSAESYRSIPRIFLDLVLWIGFAAAAVYFQRWWLTAISIFVIGFGPFHDLLVQGHEGTHDLISRSRSLNGLFTWVTLGLAGISAEAHRRFHLDHHHYAHSGRDPEYRFFDRVVRGVPGWAYFFIPMFAQIGVNAYGLQKKMPAQVRRRIALELGGAVLLHAAIAFILGGRRYLLFVIAPMVTGLYVASVLRSITEHHDVSEGSKWTNARSIMTHPLMEFLWSNVNYHLEHHLYPSVPYHALPKLRQALSPEFQAHQSNVANGYGRTALNLLKDPQHFASK